MELARTRAAAALKTMFIADALAMPVHWYYNPMDIFRDFRGGITGLEDAPAQHPSSIMSLHSTKQGGRGARQTNQQQEIVGDVILRGRREFWDQPNVHYHHGMRAGENTLNAHCARVMMRVLSNNSGRYDQSQFLTAYIEMMTADPAQHPDTYAESYHRGFFANYVSGKPAHLCGAVTHDTASIGALITVAPIVFSERLRGTQLSDVQELCVTHLSLTHPDQHLAKVCRDYVALLDELLFRNDDDTATIISAWSKRSIGLQLSEIMGKIHSDNDVVGNLFSSACYISDSWPSVLYLAYKYVSSTEAGLLSNTNLGGDNVHRGSVLGVLLGLCSAETVPHWFAQLKDREQLEMEIANLLSK